MTEEQISRALELKKEIGNISKIRDDIREPGTRLLYCTENEHLEDSFELPMQELCRSKILEQLGLQLGALQKEFDEL